VAIACQSGADPALAQTHVVVIGIGAYDYMCPPGTGAPANPGGDPQLQLMEQLTSPPVSAAAFAQWVLSLQTRNLWTQPLGSLRVLIGNNGFPDQAGSIVGNNASCAAIVADVYDWQQDLRRNPQNVGIFYFCGHGESQAGQNFVLAQDFGKVPGSFWKLAINISDFVNRMATVNCANQIYFIDACRVSTPSWTKFGPSDGDPLVNAGIQVLPAKPPTVFASPPDKATFGNNNQVSIFTAALLKALDGYVADPVISRSPWYATQSSIVSTVYEVGNLFLGGNLITPDGFAPQRDPIFQVPTEKVYGTLTSNPANILSGASCMVSRPPAPGVPYGPAVPPIHFDTRYGPHTFACNGLVKSDFAVPPIFPVKLP
jgi:hypothetical protein